MLQVLRAKDDLFIKVLASQKSSYGTSSHPLLHILGSSPPSLISPSDPLYKVRSSVDLKSIAIMAPKTLLLALGAANFASAHFGLAYPSWRADTLSGTNLTGYSQWTYPCAGVPYGRGNVTDWPLDGGSIELDLHHDWTYVFINLGLESGGNVTTHNITLTPQFWNATGSGTLCVEKLALPTPAKDGQRGSIQVVTVGESGSGLYNCADIRFTSNATTLPSDQCKTEGVTVHTIKEQSANGTNSTSGNSTGNSTSGSGSSGAAGSGAHMLALSSVVGLSMAFVFGMSL
ncbi:hypothetical protein HER10_EVM0003450 [Colletotrichum scovillei]|uniref:uncharacterized protein n=1 Tax=Colletotrichum scovillei TaxID=1209932 RepID=UPI0015C3C726|nr:uncharacterized protein HER10_EVM0003450 [Colletotrichum scovillei]KAF4784053.1 hypothetical protein HER10_EVM0003450 [Colletotrichum scovillei]